MNIFSWVFCNSFVTNCVKITYLIYSVFLLNTAFSDCKYVPRGRQVEKFALQLEAQPLPRNRATFCITLEMFIY